MTQELALEQGIELDQKIFAQEFAKHQELSRQGAAQKFKGGLADQGEETTRLHTATHLLHSALRQVLGDHVKQKGSNITSERLRFDFSHPEKLSQDQIKQVEDLVNQQIQNDSSVIVDEMPYDQAKDTGAIGLFEDKYGQVVKVYNIKGFSKEVCGGPHVNRTGELGHFRIKKEESSSAGVRRIKAVLE
jgi:alanyl-tRNA synthetase